MKSRLVVLLSVFSALLAQAADPAEPTFQGKPVTYWMDVISNRDPLSDLAKEMPTAEKAIQELGWSAVPHIIRYPGSKTPIFNSVERYIHWTGVVKACALLSQPDKQKVITAIPTWIKDKDLRIRSSAAVLMASGSGDMARSAHEMAEKEKDRIVQEGLSLKCPIDWTLPQKQKAGAEAPARVK